MTGAYQPPPFPQQPQRSQAQPGGANNDKTMAVLSHLVSFVASLIGPLIFYVVAKDSRFQRRHAAASLNFDITVALASVALVVFILVGALLLAVGDVLAVIGGLILGLSILLMFVITISTIIFKILAALAANRGEDYQYPLCLNLVKP